MDFLTVVFANPLLGFRKKSTLHTFLVYFSTLTVKVARGKSSIYSGGQKISSGNMQVNIGEGKVLLTDSGERFFVS